MLISNDTFPKSRVSEQFREPRKQNLQRLSPNGALHSMMMMSTGTVTITHHLMKMSTWIWMRSLIMTVHLRSKQTFKTSLSHPCHTSGHPRHTSLKHFMILTQVNTAKGILRSKHEISFTVNPKLRAMVGLRWRRECQLVKCRSIT